MRYQPVNLKDRSHVGKNWNRYQLRSFQIMLQATHGIVSGHPEFFMRAYGQNQEEFKRLLSLPHAFLFNRDHFEFGEGRGHRDEYEALREPYDPKPRKRELVARYGRVLNRRKKVRRENGSPKWRNDQYA